MGDSSVGLDEAFEAARAEFVSGLKRRKLATAQALSKAATVDDVAAAIRDIEEKQQRSGKLRALGRLKPVVKGLQEYAGVVEVFAQVKPDILGLIWGPLKLILKAVSDVASLFDKMMEVFVDIGRILPQFKKYQEVLNEDQIQPVLTLFYKEILATYSVLLEFLKHPGRNSFIDAIWPHFRGKIDAILDHIKDHERVLMSHVTLEHVLQSHRERQRAVEAEEQAKEARNWQYWKEMEKGISPRTYDDKLHDILCDSCHESGLWLEKKIQFRSWKDGEAKSRCLWLSGIPGAGKTYLSANTIRRLQGEGHPVLFLFFSHNDPVPSRTHTLHSLLFQFLNEDPTLRPEVFRTYSSNERKFSSDPEWVRGLLSQVLRDAEIFVVVDGLDELDEKIRGPFARDILAVLESCPELRLLVSSRDETDLRKEFTCKRALKLRVQEHNSSDVKKYVQTKCDELVNSLKESGASQETCDQIRAASATVSQKTGGMMLYAHLVFRVAKDLGNEADIRKEFLDLPKDLYEAYGRILRRIQNSHLSLPLRTVAVKILSWVACAERLLREEELLQILVVVPGAADFTKGTKEYRNILHACGPILEIAGGIVRFVHFSAKEYLLDKQSNHFLDLAAAHVDAATICATYLSFSTLDPVFETATTDADAMKCEISRGSYVFLDYAILSWIHHVKMIGEYSKTADATDLAGLAASLETLLRKRGQSQFRRTASAKVLLPMFRIFKDYVDLQSSLCSATYFWGGAELGLLDDNDRQGGASNADPTNLIVGLKNFRASLETMICSGSEHTSLCRCEDIFQLYGNALYHCDNYHCLAFRKGYDSASARDGHIQAHTGISRSTDIRYTDDNLSPDGDAMQSESDTELLEVSKDDRHQVLKDLVCSGSLDLIRNLWPEEQLDYGISRIVVQLAAVKGLPHMVEFVISKCPPEDREQQKANALAVAIEMENLACIKTLLSIGADMKTQTSICDEVYGHIPCKRLRGHTIKEGKRQERMVLPGFDRAFGLLRPELMKFLVHECGITVPRNSDKFMGLFRYIGFRNAHPDEVSTRLEAMKMYIHEDWKAQGIYKYALWGLLSQSVHENALCFCLENGADPNELEIALAHRTGQRLVEALWVLLRYGADPNHPSLEKEKKKKKKTWQKLQQHLRLDYDMSWEEFAKRAKAGESLERVRKRKREE